MTNNEIYANRILNLETTEINYLLENINKIYYLIFGINCEEHVIEICKDQSIKVTGPNEILSPNYDPSLYGINKEKLIKKLQNYLIGNFGTFNRGGSINFYVYKSILVYIKNLGKFTDCITVYTSNPEDIKEFTELLDIEKTNDGETTFNYITCDSRGNFDYITREISRNKDVDLDLNYNDDLPNDKFNEYIQDEGSGLFLMYGIPGCGKSTYIKKLITGNHNIPFFILESDLLQNITSANFISFIIRSCSGSVCILEDCEKLLASRESTYNPLINSMLNLSDGILGDTLGIKFICTFNTNIDNIDAALLRKGRLKLKYEFKELSLDKTKKLYPKATKPMTLADIYNLEENDMSKNSKTSYNKIGF